MNIERLHKIAAVVSEELKTTNIVPTIDGLVSSLENQINQPQDPQHQQNVSRLLQELLANLGKSTIPNLPPSWRQQMQEIGMLDYLGPNLRDKISEIFIRNQITPSIALAELKVVQNSVKKIQQSVDQLRKGFLSLSVGQEELSEDECEVAVSIPRDFVENKIDKFGKELGEIHKIIGVFLELSIGARDSIPIRGIASSDLSVFLGLPVETGALIIFAIDKLLDVYSKILTIKQKRQELGQIGLNEEALKSIDKNAKKLIEEKINELVDELKEESKKILGAHSPVKGRDHELDTELRISLNKIANRLDHGVNIEVRTGPVKEPEEAAGEASLIRFNAQRLILEKSANKNFIKSDTPPILQLPETAPEDKGDKKKS